MSRTQFEENITEGLTLTFLYRSSRRRPPISDIGNFISLVLSAQRWKSCPAVEVRLLCMQLGTRFSDELIACTFLPVNVDGCRRRYLYSACFQQTLIQLVLHHLGGGVFLVPTSTLCNKFCRILFPLLNEAKIVVAFTG